MFDDLIKNANNSIEQKINEGFEKIKRNMHVGSTSTGSNAQDSSALRSAPLENPPYGMTLNFYNGQTRMAQASSINKDVSGNAIVLSTPQLSLYLLCLLVQLLITEPMKLLILLLLKN